MTSRRRGPLRRALRDLRQAASYGVFRLILAILALVPRRLGHAAGRGLGRLFRLLSPRHRRIAADNLRRALGGSLPEPELRRIARASFGHLGMLLFDVAYLPRLARRPLQEVAVFEGVEHLRAASAAGRGTLVFSGHYGHWELVALLQNRLGFPMTMVVRMIGDSLFDPLITRVRRVTGNEVVTKKNAAREVLRALRRGRSIALLIDQNVRGEGGVFVDFFGIPASTTPSLAVFAFKTGAPIVPVFSRPLPDGRLAISYRPPIRAERRGRLEDDIRDLTRACTAILEDEVRRHPEHWLWMHRRWRTRPPEESPAGVRSPAPAAVAPPPPVAPHDREAAGETRAGAAVR